MPGSVHSDDDNQTLSSKVMAVEMLQNHGIGAADIAKLRAAKLNTVGMVSMCSRRKMLDIKGFSELKIEKIKEAAQKCMPGVFGFITAFELRENRRNIFTISTGSKAFDAMLGGGFHSSSICQVYGEYRCGKSQLAQTMCVTSQLPKEMGGAEGKAIFINTEGTFRPARISQMAERYGLDDGAALENITFARCCDTESLQHLIDTVGEFLVSGEYRLIVVDSVIALFRAEFVGRGELSERQQALGKFMHQCNKVVHEFNVCILLTNQVMSDPQGSAMFVQIPKASGGHILSHSCQTIVQLRKGRGEERVAKLLDSPDMPESDCAYVISGGGITDTDGK